MDPCKEFKTREDKLLDRIDELAEQLREKPLLPLDPRDHTRAYQNLESGVRLPLLHCAFKGCTWCADFGRGQNSIETLHHWTLEWVLFLHLMKDHKDAFTSDLISCGLVTEEQRRRLSQFDAASERPHKQVGQV